MWMRMILMAACAGVAWGHRVPPRCALPPIERYLGLECFSAQWQSIERNNDEHSKWRQQKERRIYQVKSEIDDETKRSPLDPAAIGLRYAEVEAICREIDEREKQLIVVNRHALTAGQKTKLSALEEAMKLAPIANEGVKSRLIDGDAVQMSRYFDLSMGIVVVWPPSSRKGACAGALRAIAGLPLPQFEP